MPRRLGLGPVFVYESLMNARRWKVYAGRSGFVLVLLVGMLVVWIGQANRAATPGSRPPSFREMAEVGRGFFYALTGIQVSLVLLAAPAAAAGSICMDRARGTLLHMMVTDLSDAEIVLGKLAARLAPVLGLIACGVPVEALAALLGGIEFGALGGAFVVSLALAVLGCTLALAISIRATRMHEVLMAVYVVQSLWLLALPIWWGMTDEMKILAPPMWFQMANPFVLVFAPYNAPGAVDASTYAAFVGVVLALSAALVGLTIWRLRRAVVEQSGWAEKAAHRRLPALRRILPSWPSPTLDGNPVLWREWHRNRPSRLTRRLWAALFLVTWVLAAWGTYGTITEGASDGSKALGAGFMFQLTFGLLMLSATAPTALAEERVRGSLDVLLATPLPTASIVVAKWWGMYRRVLVLALLPLYAGVFLSATSPDLPAWVTPGTNYSPPPLPLTDRDRILGAIFCPADFLASGALIVSLGVALSTWVRRMGRAIALSVIHFVLAGIGWVFLLELLVFELISNQWNGWVERHQWLAECLMALSPVAGPLVALEAGTGFSQHSRTPAWIGLGVVVLVKAASAGLLLWLTVRTFDRCLGRVPESVQSCASGRDRAGTRWSL